MTSRRRRARSPTADVPPNSMSPELPARFLPQLPSSLPSQTPTFSAAHQPHQFASHVWHPRVGSLKGPMVVASPAVAAGRGPSRRRERDVISLRRMSLGSGYRYLMESVATGDGAAASPSVWPLLRRVGDPAGRVPRRRAGCPRRRPRGREGFGGHRAAPVQPARDVRRPGDRQGAWAASPTARTSPWRPGWRSESGHPGQPPATPSEPNRGPRIEAEERAEGATFRDPGGRVRPHLLAIQVGVDGLGAGRSGRPRRSSTTAIAGPSTSC